MRNMSERAAERDDMEKRGREWKVVALVLDRLFFFIYLVVLLVSAFTLFKATLVQDAKDKQAET